MALFLPATALAKQCEKPQRVTRPCVGDLLPIKLSAKGISCIKTCKKEWEAKLAHANKVHAAEKKSLVVKSDAYKKRGDEFKSLLDKALEKPKKKYLLDTHEGWFAVGVVVGFGGAVAVAFLTK